MATVAQARAAFDKYLERKVRAAFYKAEGWQQATIASGTPPQGSDYNYVFIVAQGDSGSGLTQAIALNSGGLSLTAGDVVWVALNLRNVLVIKELYS